MADVSVNMGVSGIAQFKQGMKDAEAGVKTLDAALKANEKQFQKTGDAEANLAAKTTLLNQKLQQQKNIVKNAEQALKQMEANGVKTSSASYQNMQRRLIEAQSAMQDTEAEIDRLGTKEVEAAGKTDQLANSLGGLNKKVSLEQVQNALNSITGGMERAAQKAADFGKQLWDSIMDSASRADDTATMAEMYGIDLDRFQRMQKLVANGLDTSVEAILTAQDKLKKGIGKGNKEVMEYMTQLGLMYESGKGGTYSFITDDTVEMFWKAGQAIMAMGDAYDQEAAAQAMFGRSWKELVPLFNKFGSLEEYNAALAEQQVNSEETIRDLAELNDAVAKLESSWTTLKDEMLGSIAPALEKGANAISKLLDSIMEYLQTPEGQAMLEDMGKAVSELFSGIENISAEDVVSGFKDIFDKVLEGVKWIANNKEKIGAGMTAAFGLWGTLKVSSGVLDLIKLFNGIKDIFGTGAVTNVANAGKSLGEAFGGAFVKALSAAAPWLTPLLGAAFSVGGILGVQQMLKGEDYEYTDEYDPNRFTEEQLAIIRQGYKGMLNANSGDTSTVEGAGKAAADLQTELVAMAKAAGSAEKFFDLFVLNNGQNLLGDMLALGEGYRGDLYNALEQAFGGNYQQWGLSSELMNMYGDALFNAMINRDEMNKAGTLGGYGAMDSIWMAMMGHFKEYAATEPAEIPVEPEVPDDAAAKIAAEIGTVPVSAELLLSGPLANYVMPIKGHANGLPWVPFDGYAAILHRGERVLTARENKSYTYNNNNYFGSVNLNNGLEIEALTESLARQNQRKQAGYGG